ncbi:MAG TPA: acyloxyacyl hydrolase, partial [Chitinophagales bacterium]|nr:acyloxyacyl hydrolase [Chitinophagales bacterium]
MSNYRPPAYSPLSASTVRLLMFVLLTGIFNAAHADEKPKKKKEHFIIEAQYAAGKVMPVYKGFPATSFSNVAEIHLGYQTNGKQAWNRYLNYPRLGFSLIYQNLGNNHVLGQQFSIVPTVYFSTARRDDAKVYAEIRYGLGLACFNRPYDSISNPQNFGAGEHFMWQFTVGANLHWNFSRYASLQVGGIWYHASDAHTQLPNVGVNNFAGYLGILVYPFGRLPRTHQRDTVAIEKKWHVGFRFGSGYQERGNAFGPIGGPKYPVYTASVYVMHRVAKFLLLKAGATYR